ncbi:MAG: alpha/beta hydrolase [Candidatus Staskawiczbacteria bacterium]|nr:alpha/beta hydrolase [Candidatus Staskawiczbacteria bacterium]
MTEQKFLVKDLQTNCKIYGNGTPFLILHGWGSSSDKWQKIGQIVSEKGFKVIIPDMPGFGKSEIPKTPWDINNYVSWLEELIKVLNLQSYYLLGHSFGGAVAVKVVVDAPQKINKLFLVSCAYIRKRTLLKKVLSRLAKVVKVFYFLPHYALVRKAFYKFFIKKSDYVYAEGVMKETYSKVISEDLSYYLSFIKVPTVIIWGDKDKSTPVKNAYFLNKKISGSKLIVIPDAVHNLNQKSPEILIEKVLENLK